VRIFVAGPKTWNARRRRGAAQRYAGFKDRSSGCGCVEGIVHLDLALRSLRSTKEEGWDGGQVIVKGHSLR